MTGGPHGPDQASRPPARLGAASGRWVILATVLGSGMALLDATAVNVALPAIGRGLHASLAGLQWVISGYILALAALILLGGSLGDRVGRRRIFLTGVAWFALASALCGLAPDIGVLIAARVLQGIGGALLVPGSMAIISAAFAAADRPAAIGAWSGLGGLASAAGPLLGGWLVTTLGWRWVFLLNLPIAAVILAVAHRHLPESRDRLVTRRFDVLGAVLAALALAGISYALIGASGGSSGGGSGAGRADAALAAALAAVAGLAAGAGFLVVERRRQRPGARGPAPMLPFAVFASRQFTVINLITFCVYAAVGGTTFLLVLQLQVSDGFSALAAGASMLPVTAALLVLSPRSARLAQRIGPRWPIAAGALIAAAGLAAMTRIGPGAGYLAEVAPAVTAFGLGMALIVAPLTATVLASAPARYAGVASGVNNAVARSANLLAVAGLPAAVGLSAAGYRVPADLTRGFHAAMAICAGAMVVAAVLAAATVDEQVLRPAGPRSVVQAEGERRRRRRGLPVVPPDRRAGGEELGRVLAPDEAVGLRLHADDAGRAGPGSLGLHPDQR